MVDDETVETVNDSQNTEEATTSEESVETTKSGQEGGATTPLEETAETVEGGAGEGEAATPGESDIVTKREHKKRVDKLTQQKYDKEREAEFWKKEALSKADLPLSGDKTAVLPETPPELTKPKLDDFDTDADFYQANTRYEVQEALRGRDARERQIKEADQEESHRVKFQGDTDRTLKQGREKYPDDFDEVAFAKDVMYSGVTRTLVMESEFSADLAYYLGNNKEEAGRIAALPSLKAAVEIGKLEVKLSSKSSKTTNAPAPIKPLGGGKEVITKKPGDMTKDEWMAWRKQDLASRKKEI